MQEIAGDAALYADANDHTAIADSMMRLYKDENLRNHLIEKGTVALSNSAGIKQPHFLGKQYLKALVG